MTTDKRPPQRPRPGPQAPSLRNRPDGPMGTDDSKDTRPLPRMSDTPRPPNDRGQGRKPLPPDQKVRVRTVRMTDEQWEKFSALGGAAWLRDRIEKAKVKE